MIVGALAAHGLGIASSPKGLGPLAWPALFVAALVLVNIGLTFRPGARASHRSGARRWPVSGRDDGCSRRGFVRAALGGVAGALVPLGGARAASFSTDVLQVWSCGGLSEGMRELNAAYERRAGVRIHYTGAFARTATRTGSRRAGPEKKTAGAGPETDAGQGRREGGVRVERP
jgi:hypothetical protein